ncbi:hypothetical protein PN441_15960 [Spirulina major CS-329]|nr:hypothetical protein [Spirulina major CS-329]
MAQFVKGDVVVVPFPLFALGLIEFQRFNGIFRTDDQWKAL